MKKNIYDDVKILDVTLRDGGYLTNFAFNKSLIKKHLLLCERTGVDYVEVGYRNGTCVVVPNIGESGLSDNYYLEFCRKNSKSKLAVMVHPKNVTKDDFRDIKKAGVNAVRVIFSKADPSLAFRTIEEALKNNLETFVNITRISEYTTLSPLSDMLSQLSQYPLTAIYVADSNGNLYPKTTKKYIKELRSYLRGKDCGFHAHDNLSLAHANVIGAIEAGTRYVDSSVLGFGRGKGNAKTEDLVPFVVNMASQPKYDVNAVIDLYKLWLSQDISNDLLTSDNSVSILSGMKNLNAEALRDASMYSYAKS